MTVFYGLYHCYLPAYVSSHTPRIKDVRGVSVQVSTIYHSCGYCVEGDVLDVTGREILRLSLGFRV